VACEERSVRNLGGPVDSCHGRVALKRPAKDGPSIRGEQVRGLNSTGGTLKVYRESDQLIVLRGGRAVHMGKGLAVVRSRQRKHGPDKEGRGNSANLTDGNSK